MERAEAELAALRVQLARLERYLAALRRKERLRIKLEERRWASH